MKSLEIIEKMLDKESDSSKTGSHGPPKRKWRSRSINKHRRHSPKYSNKKANSSSSPYPTRNHRRFGVDELKGELNNTKPPTFDGEHKKEEDVETWLLGMQKHFQL
jgi:hypothetical protein